MRPTAPLRSICCVTETTRTLRSQKDLLEIYSPTSEEIEQANVWTQGFSAKLCFLVLLKTFQRLGYFVLLRDVPRQITQHISECIGGLPFEIDMEAYDASGSRRRHVSVIRQHLKVTPYGPEAKEIIGQTIREAAKTKEDLADIINVAVEELVRHNFELPAFGTLHEEAQHGRADVNRTLYTRVADAIGEVGQKTLNALFEVDESQESDWQKIKDDIGAPTVTQLRLLVKKVEWMKTINAGETALMCLPDSKVKQFAAEAKSLDAARMKSMEVNKRMALAACLVKKQLGRILDDVGEMFVKRMTTVHNRGRADLIEFRRRHHQEVDSIVGMLLKLLTEMQNNESPAEEQLAAMRAHVGIPLENAIAKCQSYAAYANDNYMPFLWKHYKSSRSALFSLLDHVDLINTSQDDDVFQAIAFLREHRNSKSEWLPIETDASTLPLSWISDKWWKLVTGESSRKQPPTQVNRRQFEVCVFSQVMNELKAGDLCIDGGDKYADYRGQLVTWTEFYELLDEYAEQVGIDTDPESLVRGLKDWLTAVAARTDSDFPNNESVTIENREPKVKRPGRRTYHNDLNRVKKLIAERMERVNILDVLVDTEKWVGWTKLFGPLSGYDAKIDDPRERYLTTTFCYGCDLGPSQTAQCVPDVDRRQLAWANQRHIREANLETAITEVINQYNMFRLPKVWGSGKSASADGTKWDLYEQNLLSEYHVRYGGYGGIGYYHVSDNYIALFSRFIPCGVWEAVYILDGLIENKSDIQPDTLHADTQGQNLPVFGLAYLLGIKLMPRIRNWTDLHLYRPSKETRYEHIDELFDEPINWSLIETHMPDMLRVAVSIKAGKIPPSMLLRKLSTYSKKNKLYIAMRELGRVVRTVFLLEYLSDTDLRRTINAATNKSQSFNDFTKWVAFGGDGTIRENDRDKQRKLIKFNHLVANCLILHNVQSMSRILHKLAEEGHEIDDEVLSGLSPYGTSHVNRFGKHTLDLERASPEMAFEWRNQTAPAA